MNFLSCVHAVKSFLTSSSIQILTTRNGHQMCTRNNMGRPRPKRRGIKRGENTLVHAGMFLVTQRQLKFHPGMNVGITKHLNLFAKVPGFVKVSCEKFDPDFKNPKVYHFYQERQGQSIYKKYFNVIPFEQRNRFKIVDLV